MKTKTKYLWSRVALTWRVLRDSMLDTIDDMTGAADIKDDLVRENERLTDELCLAKEQLAEMLRERADLNTTASFYRRSAAKAHAISVRYARHDRCDHLARGLYSNQTTTPQGTLASTSRN